MPLVPADLEKPNTKSDPGSLRKVIVYTIGLDQIAQSTTTYTAGVPGAATTLVFGADGHGSTRFLTGIAGAIATVGGTRQVFDYDAYGNLLNIDASQAATSFLYSGESFDARIGQQYLRARWYDPKNGRMGSLDSAPGNTSDPQTLHKYNYTLLDPVNACDPSGRESLTSLMLGISIGNTIQGIKSGVDMAVYDAVKATAEGVRAQEKFPAIFSAFAFDQILQTVIIPLGLALLGKGLSMAGQIGGAVGQGYRGLFETKLISTLNQDTDGFVLRALSARARAAKGEFPIPQVIAGAKPISKAKLSRKALLFEGNYAVVSLEIRGEERWLESFGHGGNHAEEQLDRAMKQLGFGTDPSVRIRKVFSEHAPCGPDSRDCINLINTWKDANGGQDFLVSYVADSGADAGAKDLIKSYERVFKSLPYNAAYLINELKQIL